MDERDWTGGGWGGWDPPGGRGRASRGAGSWGAGPPPWVAGLFGLAQQAGSRGPKVRRGDVRTAILDVLAVEPMNGYQVIQQIAERTDGAWKPSPGSVYPTLQQLEDEGLVEADESEGRRTLRLSAAGQEYVAGHADELAATWRAFDEPAEGPATGPGGASPGSLGGLRPVIGQVMAAVWQIVTSGNRQQQAEAAEILGDTRRRLYGLLADGDPE